MNAPGGDDAARSLLPQLLNLSRFLQPQPNSAQNPVTMVPPLNNTQPMVQNAPAFLQPMNGSGLAALLPLLNSLAPGALSRTLPQQTQAPTPNLTMVGIQPSAANDVDVAARLRDARRHHRSYKDAAESMALTHGHSASDWKDYALDRLDNILALVGDRGAPPTPPATALRPISTSSLPRNMPETPTAIAARSNKRARPVSSSTQNSTSGRAGPSRAHKRPRRYDDGDDDSDSLDSDLEVIEPVARRNGRIPEGANIVTSPVHSDLHRNYHDTEEMGSPGQAVTAGDLNAIARWILNRPHFHNEGYSARWTKFSEKYPARSMKAWGEIYRLRKGEIERRMSLIAAGGPEDAEGSTYPAAVRGTATEDAEEG